MSNQEYTVFGESEWDHLGEGTFVKVPIPQDPLLLTRLNFSRLIRSLHFMLELQMPSKGVRKWIRGLTKPLMLLSPN